MKKHVVTSGLVVIFGVVLAGCQNNDMVSIAANDAKGYAAFKIDVFEAHLETDTTGTSKAVSTAGKAPAVSLNFATAKAACESAGKRLCTAVEWTAACRGMSDVAFGFQDTLDSPKKVADVCNVGKAAGASTGVQTAGKFSNCRSGGYSVADMIGNVSEWTTNGDLPVVSGSNGYSDVSDGANLDCNVSSTASATDTSVSTGFRCCKTP